MGGSWRRVEFLRKVTLIEAKPPPMGVVTGPFSATRLRSMEWIELARNVLLVSLEGLGAHGVAFPLKARSGCCAGAFQYANNGVGHFGADAVSGNQGDGVLFGHSQSFLLRQILRSQPR